MIDIMRIKLIMLYFRLVHWESSNQRDLSIIVYLVGHIISVSIISLSKPHTEPAANNWEIYLSLRSNPPPPELQSIVGKYNKTIKTPLSTLD